MTTTGRKHLRIASIFASAHRVPLREKFVSAKYLVTHREIVVVRVVLDDAREGIGWCVVNMGGLSVLSLIESYLTPLIVGEDPRNVERLWDRMWEDSHFTGPGGITTLAIGALDIALWDLRAKLGAMPLFRLLGGARDNVPVYASAVNLHLERDALLEQTESYLRQGYTTFKIKLGRPESQDDLERVAAVRKLIGEQRTLLLDANQKWKAGEAVTRCRELAPFRPGWIEEPVSSDDIDGAAFVRAHGGLSVALGEQLCNRFEFWNFVRAHAVDVIQPNPWKVGGITEWLKIAHMAQHANLWVAPHNAIELSVHLVAGVPNGLAVENIFGGSLHDLGVAVSATEVRDGMVRLAETPGHGVELDLVTLEGFRIHDGTKIERRSSARMNL